MRTNGYTGHGENTGGLQAHSVGELYPLDVYGQETPNGTRYGVIDLSSGDATGGLWSVKVAHGMAKALKAEAPARAREIIRSIARP
jgi:hypothetical protein